MSQAPYDAIVIGTGQAGPSLAVDLAKAGRRVAVIERRRFGGTCVNTGCIPTKALVASARVAYMARRGADFGVVSDGVSVDMAAVKARKDAIVRRSNTGVEAWLRGTKNLTVYEGHGRFEGPHLVRAGDDVLEAEQIFVDVGGRAHVPLETMPGLDAVDFLTNSSMMHVDVLPEHLIVVGGSYIGLEFAQMYRRFGSRVTVVEMGDRLIRRDDDDVSQAVKEVLEADGVTVRLNAELARPATASGSRSRLTVATGSLESSAVTCCWLSGGVRILTIWESRPPASSSMRGATSWSTSNFAPTSTASGRLAIATDVAPSRTPRTTTTRLWWPIFSAMIRDVSRIESLHMACMWIRRLVGSG